MTDSVPGPRIEPSSDGARPDLGKVPIWLSPVTYGAVGATQAADLLHYPPSGYRAIERTARIGHGPARYEFASALALTWGIQRSSGLKVRHIGGSGGADDVSTGNGTDDMYGPDSARYLRPGDTVELVIPAIGPLVIRAPARVVYLIDEPRRQGFAYGTLPGHPEDGEEAFIVSHRDDDSVWLTIRAFSRPSSRWWWAVYPALRLAQELYTRRYLRALAWPME